MTSTQVDRIGPLMPNVATVAQLRANLSTLPTVIYLAGYTTGGDGGEGPFWNDTSDTTSADNGGTILVDANGARWHRLREGSDLQILWFGGNTVTDYAPLLTTALAQSDFPGGAIYFPPGIYNFASPVTFTYPSGSTPFSLTLRGAGADVSILNWTSTNGLIFNMSKASHTIHVLDLSITCSSVGTSVGVQLTQTATLLNPQLQNDFTGVTFRGADAVNFTNYWATAVILTTLNETNFIGCDFLGGTVSGVFSGIGVVAQGTSISEPCFIQNFVACSFSNIFEGVTYGDFLQGMTFSQCNFGGMAYAVHQHAGSGATFVGAELMFSGCQFNATSVNINIEGTLDDISVANSLLYQAFSNMTGIGCTPTSVVNRLVVTGNQFEGGGAASGTAAIVLHGVLNTSVVICGNAFYANTTCVFLPTGGTTLGVCITGNTMQGLTVSGTAGVVLTGTNAYTVVTGNIFTVLGTGVDLGPGSSFGNVQSNAYNTCTNNTQNTGTSNTIGGGSA